MEATTSGNEKLYKLTVEAKSDAVLSVIGQQILAKRAEEIRQSEEEPIAWNLSHETQKKIVGMIKEEKRIQIMSLRKTRVKKLGKVCAMIILALGISGTILINSSEAFRYKFDNFWVEVKTEYLGLKPNGNEPDFGSDSIEKLSGLWCPKYLPDGFSFLNLNDMGAVKELTFSDENGSLIALSAMEADGTNLLLDNEADESGQVKINQSYDGYWAKNENTVKLVWLQSDHVFQLSADLELNEIVKIAESLEYQK